MVEINPEHLELLQKRMLAIAQEAHALLHPGMSLYVHWQEKQALILPGQEPVTHTMIITKPDMLVQLRAK